MTYEEYAVKAQALRARCERIDVALWRRANDVSGIGPMRNMWANAMLARDSGKPWSEVNYSNLRRAMRIDVTRARIWTLFDAITTRWHKSTFKRSA